MVSPDIRPAPEPRAGESGSGAPLALVVDDDGYMRRLLRMILETDGLRVVEVVDGSKAVDAAVRQLPDIILLDILMQGMDGIAVCRQLRAVPTQAAVPIVMITGVQDDAAINAAYDAGATDFILKPPNVTATRQRVRTLLRARQAEAALRASEERAQAIIEAVADPVLILDVDHRICHWNPAATRIFGYAPGEVLGESVALLLPGTEGDPASRLGSLSPELAEKFADAVALGEITLQRRDGTLVETEVSISAFEMHGKLHRACVVRDLTERNQMLAHMMAGQKLADLGTLAAGVAHEINSPLQVITGASSSLLHRLIQDDLDGPTLQHKLELIHRSGWRCAEIVRVLLTYAHPQNLDVHGEDGRYDLGGLVRDTLLLIEHQLQSWSNVTVKTELAENLPPLRCDRNQITQVVINLLTNARDAMPGGGEITIRTCLASEPGKLLLMVADNGCGIPEAIQHRVFDPFFTTKPLGQGTGLGLSLVVGIVRGHGGAIHFESAPSRGTVFSVTLPIDGDQPPPAEPCVASVPVRARRNGFHLGRFDEVPA